MNNRLFFIAGVLLIALSNCTLSEKKMKEKQIKTYEERLKDYTSQQDAIAIEEQPSLPRDIDDRISQDYLDAKERQFVKRELLKLVKRPLNVGGDQLCRSILFLAEGKLNAFKELMDFDDPRDVLVEAEKKNGSPGHYFTQPFN